MTAKPTHRARSLARDIAAVVGVLLASEALAVEPLDFKGLPFGSDQGAIVQKFADARCTSTATFDGCFLADHTYAGEKVERITLELIDGTLQRVGVSFSPASFEAIVDALASKHGQPSAREDSTFTTAGGTKAPNTYLVWSLPGGLITISRYSRSITTGYLAIRSNKALAALEAKEKERPNRAKRDI